jgi:hypothetical protein
MENLTIKQLKDICSKHKYIKLRFSQNNIVAGYNCKIAFITRLQKDENTVTKFYSYNVISFMEYISIKLRFIPSTNPRLVTLKINKI